jgi:lipopolysaccharide transport system permease protein
MYIKIGLLDLKKSLSLWRLWSLLGWLDIRQRYARSKLGPFWLTVSMGVLVVTMGVVYGALFGQDVSTYLPMVAIGIVVWTLFSSIVSEGSGIYISSASYIKQIPTPRLIYVLQITWKNVLIFLHNFIIIILVILFTGFNGLPLGLLSLFGLVLLVINAAWMAAFSGMVSARFRDFPQIVQSFLQVAFYITPVIFEGKMLGKFYWIAKYNPLAHLVSLVRDPLMGVNPHMISWLLVSLMAVTGWGIVLYFLGKYHKRIPYWV